MKTFIEAYLIAAGAALKTNASNQFWERRGSAVYGEDNGPGTAPLVVDFHGMDVSISIVERIVKAHNAIS